MRFFAHLPVYPNWISFNIARSHPHGGSGSPHFPFTSPIYVCFHLIPICHFDVLLRRKDGKRSNISPLILAPASLSSSLLQIQLCCRFQRGRSLQGVVFFALDTFPPSFAIRVPGSGCCFICLQSTYVPLPPPNHASRFFSCSYIILDVTCSNILSSFCFRRSFSLPSPSIASLFTPLFTSSVLSLLRMRNVFLCIQTNLSVCFFCSFFASSVIVGLCFHPIWTFFSPALTTTINHQPILSSI
ncbi:hypothetical protein BXZ70DRAFT_32294 [Cristinia sonorae]|uniref:Uncharacterized protein n=1 Tax=Cristinia sonorae TaxID=1940300 RepID=A0A8K0V289_9AGAR|nr:hypothetical protein BXZ70DRAFT_32294 [Cristinia sonorae]